MSEEKVEKHESFGIVRVIQSQGGSAEFFGSPANTMHSYICFEVAPGEVDWKGAYPSYTSSRKAILRFRMTHAQFVGLMSSLGNGTGTPCTLEYRTDKDGTQHRLQDPPAQQFDTDRVHAQFKSRLKKLDMRLNFYYNQLDEMLNKKTLTKTDKDAIRESMRYISQEIRDNIPYMSSMFNEAAERIVGHAKNEIDAALNTYVKNIGIKAIKSGFSNLLGNKEPSVVDDVPVAQP